MAKSKGLGKGLGALISQYDSNINSYDNEGKLNKGVNEIDIADIEPNPDQPRKRFDESSLRELAASINTHGVIQPIILAPYGERYRIVAGERRYRAARIAKLEKIPAIIVQGDIREQQEIMIIENLQREDLNAIEEAYGLDTLIKEFNMTQEQLAQRLGKSRPALTNSLRLLSLPKDIQDMVRDSKLTAGHARCLVSVKDAVKQRKLANLAAENKLTVRQLEMEVNSIVASKKSPKSPPKKISLELRDLSEQFRNVFSTRVQIKGTEQKGKVVIDYTSKDELNRIYDIITKNRPKF